MVLQRHVDEHNTAACCSACSARPTHGLLQHAGHKVWLPEAPISAGPPPSAPQRLPAGSGGASRPAWHRPTACCWWLAACKHRIASGQFKRKYATVGSGGKQSDHYAKECKCGLWRKQSAQQPTGQQMHSCTCRRTATQHALYWVPRQGPCTQRCSPAVHHGASWPT